jgi:hypothetical protein
MHVDFTLVHAARSLITYFLHVGLVLIWLCKNGGFTMEEKGLVGHPGQKDLF